MTCDALIDNIINTKLYRLLPINSGYKYYAEVEEVQPFLRCREITLSVAAKDAMHPILLHIMNCIEHKILGGNTKILEANFEQFQSILVLMRLLDDVIAYNWDTRDKKHMKESELKQTHQMDNTIFNNKIVGFASTREHFHITRPSELVDNKNLIYRLLNLCYNLKCHVSTTRILQNASDDLFGQYLHLRYMLLPDYQELVKSDSLMSNDATLMDLTINHLQLFLAASNPDQYSHYLNDKFLRKYLQPQNPNDLIKTKKNDFELIKFYDLFGCISLTSREILHFLEIIKKLCLTLGKSIFTAVLLEHCAKAIFLWIISRPDDFLRFTDQYQANKLNNASMQIGILESLFDHVYSTFHISSILSTNSALSSSPTESTDLNTSSNSNSSSSLNPFTKSFNKPNHTHDSNSLHSMHLNSGGPSRTPKVNGQVPIQRTARHTSKSSKLLSSYKVLNLQSAPNDTTEKDTVNGSSNEQNPYSTYHHGTQFDNIASLMTSYYKNKALNHFSIFRFLSALVILDSDALNEANRMSFKDIKDLSATASNGSDLSLTSSYSSADSIPSNIDNTAFPPPKPKKMLSFGSSIKKFTNISPSKKKVIKFLSILLKNLNSAYNTSEVNLLNSLSALLSVFSLSASVSLVDSSAPSVLFSQRLINLFGLNLHVGRNWRGKSNKNLLNIYKKNKEAFTTLQLQYFISSLLLNTKDFLEHLSLDATLKEQNFQVLSLYTQGFVLYFHPQRINNLSDENDKIIHDFLNKLFALNLNMRASTIISNDDFESIVLENVKKMENVLSFDSLSPIDSNSLKKSSPEFTSFDDKYNENDISGSRVLSNNFNASKSSTPELIRPITATKSSGSLSSNYLLPTQSLSKVECDIRSLEDISTTVLNIFSRRIYYFFTPTNANSIDVSYIINNSISLVKTIVYGYFDPNNSIKNASKAFVKIFIGFLMNITDESPTKFTVSGYSITNAIVLMLCKILTNLNLSLENREVLLEEVLNLLRVKYYLAKILQNLDQTEYIVRILNAQLVDISATVGIPLFLSLSCRRPKIQQLVTDLYKIYYDFVILYGNIIGRSEHELEIQVDFVRSASEANYVSLGSVAFQHRLLDNIMKHLKVPNHVLVESTFIIYDRWLYLSQNKPTLSQEQFDEFRILAGMIAVSSGIILWNCKDTESLYGVGRIEELQLKFKYFISQQCIWINDSDLLTRENTRDILSNELHPLSYNILLSNLTTKIEEMTNSISNEVVDEHWSSIIEQIIIILRTIVEKDDEATKKSIILVSVELIDLIQLLCHIIKYIPITSLKYHKIVIQMLKLFNGLQSCEDKMFIKSHFELKNKWIKVIMEYFNEAVNHDYDFNNMNLSHKDMDLQKRELDSLFIDKLLEASKTIKYLSKGLPIEVLSSLTDEEVKKLKFIEFGKYFSYLFKGLEKLNLEEETPQFFKNKKETINSSIIASLTNLTSANSDVGIEYALPMGLSMSKEMKLSFIEVFINIFNSDKFNEIDDGHEKLVISAKLLVYIKRFPSLISEFSSICGTDTMDEFSLGIFETFGSSKFFYVIFKELLAEEISLISRPADTLRRNSCTTILLSLFAFSKGHNYLIRVVKPFLIMIDQAPELVDIEKLSPDDPMTEKYVSIYLNYFNSLIETILQSINIFPKEFLFLCRSIYDATKSKFPKHSEIAVGSFFFLRFICPSIISPEVESLPSVFDPSKKKVCLSMAKLLQMISNGSESYARWPSLKNQAFVLLEYREKIFSFIRRISIEEDSSFDSSNYELDIANHDLTFLHKLLYFNELKIRKKLLSKSNSYGGISELSNIFRTFDEFMEKFKPPKSNVSNDIPQYAKDHMHDLPDLYNFMSKNMFTNKNSNIINEKIINESISLDGFPTVRIAFNNIDSYNIPVNELLHQYLKLYSTIWTSKHYLVFDFTGYNFQPKNIFVPFAIFLATLVPAEARKQCSHVYYINCDPEFIEQFIHNSINHERFSATDIEHSFINSSQDGELIKSLAIKGETVDIINDSRVFLKDVQIYDHSNDMLSPVILTLGNKYIQIMKDSPKVYHLFKTAQSNTIMKDNRVYHIDKLLSVNTSTFSAQPFEFTLTFNSSIITLCCDKYLDVIKMINQSMEKIEDESLNVEKFELNPEYLGVDTKALIRRDQYIQSKLLITALIGFLDEDLKVKEVSYKLLVAIQKRFNLNVGFFLHTSPEIYMTRDLYHFICEVTQTLVNEYPDFTSFITTNILDLLEGSVISSDSIPTILACLSLWIPNLYKHVYFSDMEDGVLLTSEIIGRLVRLTVKHECYSGLYYAQIWNGLLVHSQLTEVIVDEVIIFASERMYENKEKDKVLNIISTLPTLATAKIIIGKLMNIINSFSHSLIYEATNKSWSELLLLSKLASEIFFQDTILAQTFLPEVLIIISLLIDLGPLEMRENFFALLMNVCYSLMINDNIPEYYKIHLDQLSQIFISHKLRFIYGFSQNKNRILPQLSSESFQVNFNTLEYFTDNILLLMENIDEFESAHWKACYKNHLINILFNNKSFLSARAVMILGVVSKAKTPEYLSKNILTNMMVAFAEPEVSEEQLFLSISHVYTCSKLVQGLDPRLNIVKSLFWLSAAFLGSEYSLYFEAGLTFSVLSLIKLTMVEQEKGVKGNRLVETLMDTKRLLQPQVGVIEELQSVKWNEKNYSFILLWSICRGFSYSYIRESTIFSLEQIFRNAYYEKVIFNKDQCYLSYYLLLYLILTPIQLEELKNAVELEEEEYWLDSKNKVVTSLLTWLASDEDEARINLYQMALLYSNSIIDEPGKYKFGLIMKYLLQHNPKNILCIYNTIQKELFRQVSLDQHMRNFKLAFDILGLITQIKDFNQSSSYQEQLLNNISARKLDGIKQVSLYKVRGSSLMSSVTEVEHNRLLTQKKAIVRLLSKIIQNSETL